MCADIVNNSKNVEGYTVSELTLRQMRTLKTAGVPPEDFTYHIGALCIKKPDGKPITIDELYDLPIRLGTKILGVVAELNIGSSDEKGNA